MPSQEMPTSRHPHNDEPENHGPVVSAVLWFFLAVTILSVIGRTATRSTNSRGNTRDNLLISIALVCVRHHLSRFQSVIILTLISALRCCPIHCRIFSSLEWTRSTCQQIDFSTAWKVSAGMFLSHHSLFQDFPTTLTCPDSHLMPPPSF